MTNDLRCRSEMSANGDPGPCILVGEPPVAKDREVEKCNSHEKCRPFG